VWVGGGGVCGEVVDTFRFLPNTCLKSGVCGCGRGVMVGGGIFLTVPKFKWKRRFCLTFSTKLTFRGVGGDFFLPN